MISMDKKFKPGDRVRVIRSGAVGTVKETSPHVTSVDVSGVVAWFNTDELVAAPVSARVNPDLTRRDHFAMAALTGLLANSEAVTEGLEPTISYLARSKDGSWLAETSFMLADAMEAARNKEGAECA